MSYATSIAAGNRGKTIERFNRSAQQRLDDAITTNINLMETLVRTTLTSGILGGKPRNWTAYQSAMRAMKRSDILEAFAQAKPESFKAFVEAMIQHNTKAGKTDGKAEERAKEIADFIRASGVKASVYTTFPSYKGYSALQAILRPKPAAHTEDSDSEAEERGRHTRRAEPPAPVVDDTHKRMVAAVTSLVTYQADVAQERIRLYRVTGSMPSDDAVKDSLAARGITPPPAEPVTSAIGAGAASDLDELGAVGTRAKELFTRRPAGPIASTVRAGAGSDLDELGAVDTSTRKPAERRSDVTEASTATGPELNQERGTPSPTGSAAISISQVDLNTFIKMVTQNIINGAKESFVETCRSLANGTYADLEPLDPSARLAALSSIRSSLLTEMRNPSSALYEKFKAQDGIGFGLGTLAAPTVEGVGKTSQTFAAGIGILSKALEPIAAHAETRHESFAFHGRPAADRTGSSFDRAY